MLSGLIGSILENRKLKIIIVSSLISLIFYFICPAIINLANKFFLNLSPVSIFIGLFFSVVCVGTSFGIFIGISTHYLKYSEENTLWSAYFCIASGISSLSAFVGNELFYFMHNYNFSNMYVPLIYLAGYVVNFLLYLVFNFATDRDPIGSVIVVFVGFMVVSMAAAFIALFAFNYPGIPLPPVE